MIHIFIILALLELLFLVFGSSSIQNISSSHRDIVVTGVVEALHFLLLVVAIVAKLVHALAVIALFTLMDFACRLTSKTLAIMRNALSAVSSWVFELKETLTNYRTQFLRVFDEIAQGNILAYDESSFDDDPSDDTSPPPTFTDSQPGHRVAHSVDEENQDFVKNAPGIIPSGVFPFEGSYYVPAEDPYEQLEDLKRELEKEKAATRVAEESHKQEIVEEREKRKVIEERLEQIEKETKLERTAMEAELRNSKETEKALKAELAANDEELKYVKSDLEREKTAREGAEDSYKQEIAEGAERRKFVEERLEQLGKEKISEKTAMEAKLRDFEEAEKILKAEIAKEKEKKTVVEQRLERVEKEWMLEKAAIKNELEREKSARQGAEDSLKHAQKHVKYFEERIERPEKEVNSEPAAMEKELEESTGKGVDKIQTEIANALNRAIEVDQCSRKTLLTPVTGDIEIHVLDFKTDIQRIREEDAIKEAEVGSERLMDEEHVITEAERLREEEFVKEAETTRERLREEDLVIKEAEERGERSNNGEDPTVVDQEEDNGRKLDLTILKKMFENRDKPKQVEESEHAQTEAPPAATPKAPEQDLQDPIPGKLADDQASVEGKSSRLDTPAASSSDERKNKDQPTAPLPAPSTPKNISPLRTSPKSNRKRGGRGRKPVNNHFPVNNQFPVTSTPIRYSAARNSNFRGRPSPGHFWNHRPQYCNQAYQPNHRRPQDLLYQTGTVQRSVLAPRDLNRR